MEAGGAGSATSTSPRGCWSRPPGPRSAPCRLTHLTALLLLSPAVRLVLRGGRRVRACMPATPEAPAPYWGSPGPPPEPLTPQLTFLMVPAKSGSRRGRGQRGKAAGASPPPRPAPRCTLPVSAARGRPPQTLLVRRRPAPVTAVALVEGPSGTGKTDESPRPFCASPRAHRDTTGQGRASRDSGIKAGSPPQRKG